MASQSSGRYRLIRHSFDNYQLRQAGVTLVGLILRFSGFLQKPLPDTRSSRSQSLGPFSRFPA